MKFTQKLCLAALFALPLLSRAGEELAVPKLANGENPEALLSSGVPFRTPFYMAGTNRAASVNTRFKLAHDNKNLYVAVEAAEPDTAGIVQKARLHDDLNIWRDNGLELNFTVDEKQLFKIMVNTRGDIADSFGLDDNLGTSTFIYDTSFESHAKVLSVKTGKDRWTMILAIPLGAFNCGDTGEFPPLSMQIARTRRAGKVFEMSTSSPTAAQSFSEVRSFQKMNFKDFDRSLYSWKLNQPVVRAFREEGKNMAEISTGVVNSGKQFRIGRVRTVLVDRSGKEVGSSVKSAPAHPSKLAQYKSALAFPKNGEYKIRLELFSNVGVLLAEKSMTAALQYEPVSIRFITPWYRDAIFATMPEITEIQAEILLEEGIGKELNVVLTGPESFRKEIRIARAKKVNTVKFEFKNMPDGEYFLQAGTAKKRLRKLPFSKGEVWIDRNGVIRQEGKIVMPLGVMGMPNNVGEGLNCNYTFVSPFRSKKALIDWLDQCEKVGRPAIIYPYHTFPVPYSYTWFHFTTADKQKSELTDIQKKYLKEFAELIRGHRGYLIHFLTDEPEGRDENTEWFKKVHEYLAEIDPYHPTLVNNYGIEGMRRYAECADISTIDCYWDFFKDNRCNMPTDTTWKFLKSAAELKKCTMLLPQAFDWGHVNRFGGKSRAPAFDEMRNQMYQGFLANIKGAAFFSYSTHGGQFSWQLKIGDKKIMKEFAALRDILLAPTDYKSISVKTVGKTDYPLLAGVKKLDGQFLIIAVNPSYNKVDGEFTAKFNLPEKMAVNGEKRTVAVKGKTFRDSFLPMETHVYLSEKLPSNGTDLEAIRQEIREADALRKKPGNVAAAGIELGRAEIVEYGKGVIPAGVPKITASSTYVIQAEPLGYTYFLQDGICETVRPSLWSTWSPKREDKTPWVQIDLVKPSRIRKVNLWTIVRDENAPSPVTDAHVEVLQNGTWKNVAAVKGNSKQVLTIEFAAEETSSVRIVLDNIDYSRSWGAILSEIEVF